MILKLWLGVPRTNFRGVACFMCFTICLIRRVRRQYDINGTLLQWVLFARGMVIYARST